MHERCEQAQSSEVPFACLICRFPEEIAGSLTQLLPDFPYLIGFKEKRGGDDSCTWASVHGRTFDGKRVSVKISDNVTMTDAYPEPRLVLELKLGRKRYKHVTSQFQQPIYIEDRLIPGVTMRVHNGEQYVSTRGWHRIDDLQPRSAQEAIGWLHDRIPYAKGTNA
ncbi:MAG: hypothetical protein JXA91_04075 [Candidatus Thermoplasmatota archaeon]|nr:hypothetical protein [Candidatus Thermoplasmatota archaeon]